MSAWTLNLSHCAVSPDCSAAVRAAWLFCPPHSLRHGGCLIEKIISLNTNIFYHDLIYWKTPSFDREKNRINRGKMCVAMYYTVRCESFRLLWWIFIYSYTSVPIGGRIWWMEGESVLRWHYYGPIGDGHISQHLRLSSIRHNESASSLRFWCQT